MGPRLEPEETGDLTHEQMHAEWCGSNHDSWCNCEDSGEVEDNGEKDPPEREPRWEYDDAY